MYDFTRRSLLQGGTALAAAGALTGPALLDFAKAWAQASPWKAEPGTSFVTSYVCADAPVAKMTVAATVA